MNFRGVFYHYKRQMAGLVSFAGFVGKETVVLRMNGHRAALYRMDTRKRVVAMASFPTSLDILTDGTDFLIGDKRREMRLHWSDGSLISIPVQVPFSRIRLTGIHFERS